MKKILPIITAILTASVCVTASADNGTMYESLKSGQQGGDTVINFSDVKGDEWFISHLAVPIQFGVISGYEDGTLRPNGNVIAAETAKIISTAYETDTAETTSPWYAKYYNKCAKAFTYSDLDASSNKDYFESPITRCEIAFILANYISGNSNELDDYISKAKNGDTSSLDTFVDCDKVYTDDDSTLQGDQKLISNGYIPSRFAGALSYLVDKGVMVGTDEADGRHLNPTANVSRAETFILIEKACIATDSYTAGQFKGTGAQTGTGAGSQTSSGTETGTSTSSGSTGGIEIGIGSGSTGSTGTGSSGSTGSTVWSDLENPAWTYGEKWEHYQSRENIKAYWNDPTRPRLKPGDTFVAEDGTEYVLELGPSGVLGEGLPIATDLGRMDEGGNVVTDGWQANTAAFGWIKENISTDGRVYIVYKTGEGHWEFEWSLIQDNARPQYEGTEGQWSEDGYCIYINHMWHFVPLGTVYLPK